MPSMPQVPELSVRAVRATAVEIPLRFVLGTSQGAIRQATPLLIDVETQEGVTGRSYVFAHLPAIAQAIAVMLREVEAQTRGQRATPEALWPSDEALHAGRRAGRPAHGDRRLRRGDVGCRGARRQAPLCRLLGADPSDPRL